MIAGFLERERERESMLIVVRFVSYGQFHSFLAKVVRFGL